MSFVWYCKDVVDDDFNTRNLTHEPVVSEHDTVETPYANAVSSRNFVKMQYRYFGVKGFSPIQKRIVLRSPFPIGRFILKGCFDISPISCDTRMR
jgi:hypothetical protein